MIAYVPFLTALVGLVVYLVASNPKAAELGRLAFGSGLLVGLFAFAARTVEIFR